MLTVSVPPLVSSVTLEISNGCNKVFSLDGGAAGSSWIGTMDIIKSNALFIANQRQPQLPIMGLIHSPSALLLQYPT